MRHANVHAVFQGILNAIAPMVCDDCEQQTTWKYAVQEDPWGRPTGDVYCENCAEKRWDRQQERLTEETP